MTCGVRRALVALLVLAGAATLALVPLPFDLTTTIDNRVSIARPPASRPRRTGRPGTRFHRRFVYPSPPLRFALLNRIRFRALAEAESTEAVRRLRRALDPPA